MGADPLLRYPIYAPPWTEEPKTGFGGAAETDMRGWGFGLCVDVGPESFGLHLWVGPFYLAAWYTRDRDTRCRRCREPTP